MNRLLKALFCLVVLPGIGSAKGARNRDVVVQALDGRNGKPLPNQRLLVFAGESLESVRQHKREFELETNEEGLADLKIVLPEIQQIQVWVDFHILCQAGPNAKSYSVGEILAKGLSTPNTCGPTEVPVTPGRFVVYARPAHFWEKLRR